MTIAVAAGLNNSTLQPMPSPRGTNHERLFILQGKAPNPVAACDSRREKTSDWPFSRRLRFALAEAQGRRELYGFAAVEEAIARIIAERKCEASANASQYRFNAFLIGKGE
jgi:hypothetical protein